MTISYTIEYNALNVGLLAYILGRIVLEYADNLMLK